MMELTGQTFPAKMLQHAKLRKEYFDDAGMPTVVRFDYSVTVLRGTRTVQLGKLLHIPEPTPVSLEATIAGYKPPWLSEDEIELAAGFIRACLKLDSEERPPAVELRDHEFLADAFCC